MRNNSLIGPSINSLVVLFHCMHAGGCACSETASRRHGGFAGEGLERMDMVIAVLLVSIVRRALIR